MMTRQYYIRLVHSQPVEECVFHPSFRRFNWPIVVGFFGGIAIIAFLIYMILEIVK